MSANGFHIRLLLILYVKVGAFSKGDPSEAEGVRLSEAAGRSLPLVRGGFASVTVNKHPVRKCYMITQILCAADETAYYEQVKGLPIIIHAHDIILN